MEEKKLDFLLDEEQVSVLKIILSNPDVIPEFIKTGYFQSQEIEDNLKIVNKIKDNTMTPAVLKDIFGVEPHNNTNQADIDWVMEKLSTWCITKYSLELKEKYFETWDEVEKLKEKYYFEPVKEKKETIFKDWKDVDKLYQQFKDTVVDTISSGYKEFDKSLNSYNGWMRKGLYSILGLSGFGKSIFLVNFARASFELGYRVLYISTEMTEPEINERFFQSLTNSSSFEKAALWIKQSKINYSGQFQIIKINPHECKVKDIKILIQELDVKPDIVYIDYADELLPNIKLEKEYDAQGHIYTTLKGMANDFNIPIITATQTSREAAGENGGTKAFVGFKSVADSSKKIRLVDGMYSIIQEPGDKDAGKIILQVIKSRKAASGYNIEFNINYNTMKITDGGLNIKLDKTKEKSQDRINLEAQELRDKANKIPTSKYMTTTQELQEKLTQDIEEKLNRRNK